MVLFAATLGPASELAQAGIMLNGVSEQQYIDLAMQSQFASVGTFGGVSGTLIAPNWVLTAGHVDVGVQNFFVRDSNTPYEVAEVIQHPTFVLNNKDINLGYDLELVRLKTDVVGVTPAQIYTGTLEVGAKVVITGYGAGGYGDQGATLGARLRAGVNTIDIIPNLNGGAQNAILVADFDSNIPAPANPPGHLGHNTLFAVGSSAIPDALEYHLAGGDSGGGVFMFENGQWYLVGVNSGVESQSSALPTLAGANADLFGYGALSYMTRVSSFQSFIVSNINAVPEPSTYVLLGLFASVLCFTRYRSRKSQGLPT